MIYGLFLAYSDTDLGLEQSKEPYPKEYRSVMTFPTEFEQLDAFANIPCPASQMISGEDKEDFERKVKIMDHNFDDIEWLKENVFPY